MPTLALPAPAPDRTWWTWADLDDKWDAQTGARYELVDGGLLVSPPPTFDHDRAVARIVRLLTRAAPDWAEPLGTTGVAFGPGDYRVPDVVVTRSDLPSRPSPLVADEVLLVVEVESPGTRTTDRVTKPAQYAAAGIPSYWRLTIRDAPPTLIAYDLLDGVYVEVARAEGEQEVTVRQPFPVTVRPADLLR